MKKLFTFALALFTMSMSAMAETETTTNTGTKDTDAEFTSITIPGTHVAGSGGKQVSPMPNKGVKVRLTVKVGDESINTLPINVNEGYKVTAIKLIGVTNTADAAATIGKILVDDVEFTGSFSKDLVAKNASTASTIEITGINATQSIVYEFSALNGAEQANVCFEVTYEITATTYTVTYKANNGTEDADVVASDAIKVTDNLYFAKEDAYFIGWNTAADGSGDAYSPDDKLNKDLTLYAQWADFTAEISLTLSGAEQTPAKDAAVLLTDESNGGKIYFAGAKDNNFAASFVPKAGIGMQLSKGGADSLRVELNKKLKVGSVIRIDLTAANDDFAAINLVSINGSKTIPFTYLLPVAKEDLVSVYRIVTADDNLADASMFRLQRGGSTVILSGVYVMNCGDAVPTAVESIESAQKAVKIVENGQIIIIKNGKRFNILGAEL